MKKRDKRNETPRSATRTVALQLSFDLAFQYLAKPMNQADWAVNSVQE
jgi:hypothetical protein